MLDENIHRSIRVHVHVHVHVQYIYFILKSLLKLHVHVLKGTMKPFPYVVSHKYFIKQTW